MARKRALWIAVLAPVVALAAWIALDRAKEAQLLARSRELDESLVRHRHLVDAERASAGDKLARIRAELNSSSLPTWAGEYSVAYHDGVGTVVEGFALAPNEGAVWWRQYDVASDFNLLDHGRITAATDDHVSVDWVVDSVDPHRNGVMLPVRLLSRDLVRFAWHGGEFLVPSARLAMFCSPTRATVKHSLFLAPRKGGWAFAANETSPYVSSNGRRADPIIPEAWRDDVRSISSSFECTLTSAPEVVYSNGDVDVSSDVEWLRWPPAAASDRVRSGLVRLRYTIPAGRDQGLRVGAPLFASDARMNCGVVVDASREQAQVEVWCQGADLAANDLAADRKQFSSRAPWDM